MVELNPPKQHPDHPEMEIYAQEGNHKFMRHKSNRPEHQKLVTEADHPYWSSADHS